MGLPRRLFRAALVVLFALLIPTASAAKPVTKIDASILGMPTGPWPLVRPGPKGLETYLIPTELPRINRLPEPERDSYLRVIRQHQANLSFLSRTINRFFPRLQAGNLSRIPEYARDLNEVVMAVDLQDSQRDDPLHAHEPVLKALPAYTRVVMLAPKDVIPRLKQPLNALGMADRVQTVASREPAETNSPADGVTRWVRDIMFVAQDNSRVTILTSLAHKEYEDIAHNDLSYVERINGHKRDVLRLPIFLRGGNLLAVEKGGRKLLFVGEDELLMNQLWFGQTFAFTPSENAVPEILKAVSGADEVIVLPNSRTLFHIDTFIAPLGDGQVALLDPLNAAGMAPGDRHVLTRTREVLQRLGFAIVPVPTSIQRMAKFQSPVNIVSFTDRHTGRRRALVPLFSEDKGDAASRGLNDRVLAAYRSVGIDPIPVEDRYHARGGNIHCALVPLR